MYRSKDELKTFGYSVREATKEEKESVNKYIQTISKSTGVNFWEDNSMKVTIDLENLESLVQNTMDTNIENIVKEQIERTVREVADNLAKKTIKEKVSENFQRFVDEYITNTKIKVGGDYWGDTEEKEYTVEQYIKKELKDRLESKRLQAKKRDRTSSYDSDYESVTFEEYIFRRFDPEEMIKKDLDKFMDDIRKQVNETMKKTFDNSTKSMLSNAVLNILGANETYRQIENNIKCIADKQV